MEMEVVWISMNALSQISALKMLGARMLSEVTTATANLVTSVLESWASITSVLIWTNVKVSEISSCQEKLYNYKETKLSVKLFPG